MLSSMKKPLSCGAQDMLEAAIVQQRRLNISCHSPEEGHCTYHKVLPVDINSVEQVEQLYFLTTDNNGGILKLSIDTAHITAFEAKDFKDPRIAYRRGNDDLSCGLD